MGIAGICIIGASLDGQVSLMERSACGLLGVRIPFGGVGAAGLVLTAKGAGSALLAGVFGAMLALIG